jgi:PAS domain S-box-containing protein
MSDLVVIAVARKLDLKNGDAANLLDAAPDAIIGIDTTGQIVLANAQAVRLFGYSREELVNRPVEILIPEARRRVHPGFRDAYMENPHPRPMGAGIKLAGRRKDGSEFPAEISLSAVETERETIAVAAVRDVTDYLRATEAKDLLAAIVQSSHDAIIGKTIDGIIKSWNPGAERLYGYTAQEIIDKPAEILFLPEQVAEENAILQNIASGERVAQRLIDRVRKDGTIVPVWLAASPIVNADGEIVGLATVSRDVTDQQRAEARFRGLLEAAPDAIVGVDARGRILVVNVQATQLFGYGREELVGQPVEILVPEARRALHPGHRDRYLTDPRPRPMGAGMELAGRRKDGGEFPAEISLSAVDTEHDMIAVAAVRDVTDRHRFEHRLRETNEALKRANSAKDTFLASMSHELRTPLNAIIGFTGTMLMKLPGPLNEEQERQLRMVSNSGKHLLAIINDLLDLSRIEAGKVVVTHERVDLRDTITAAVEPLRSLADGKGLALTTDLPDEEMICWSDPRALGQILINLVNNAIKFTDCGTVHVSLRAPAGGGAEVRVVDTGPGITATNLTRIFNAFDRGPRLATQDGTGLGLHISQRLAAAISARITVASTPGAGSIFTLTLTG